MLLDLDHFKSINDTLGHDGGDALLIDVASSMRAWMRDNDVLARWGGEEFLVLLGDTGVELAGEQAERLRASIEAQNFEIQQQQVSITASFGIAGYGVDTSVDRCIKNADLALYRAKANGRNRVVQFHDMG